MMSRLRAIVDCLKPSPLVAFLQLFILMALVPIYLIATLLCVVIAAARERWIEWRLPPDSKIR